MILNAKNNINMLEKSIEKVNATAREMNIFGKNINGLNETLLKLIENQSISKIEGNAENTIKSLQELNKTLDWLNDKNKDKRLDEISKMYLKTLEKETLVINNEIKNLGNLINEEINEMYVEEFNDYLRIKSEIGKLENCIKDEMSKNLVEIVSKEIAKTNKEIEDLRKFISEEKIMRSQNIEIEDKKKLGNLYYENEEYEASFEYFNKYILEEIKNGKMPTREDYYNRGKASEALGNVEKAMKDYRKANSFLK